RSWRRRRRRAGPAGRRRLQVCPSDPDAPEAPLKRKTRPYPHGESKIWTGLLPRQGLHAWLEIAPGPAWHKPTTSARRRQPLRGDHAGDTGEVPGDANIDPLFCIEERLDGGQAIVAEFQNQQAAGLQMLRCLRNERAVKFVAFFAAEERDMRFV